MVIGAESIEGFHIDAGLADLTPHAIVPRPINYREERLGVLVLAYTINPKERDIQYIANLAVQFGITVVGAQQFEALQALTEELGVSRREVAIQRDEAELKSITDPLTGLHNRGYMQVELERLIQLSAP